MGADVMRWQYCAQPPDRNLLFGFGPAHEIRRRLLTLWNSAKFLVDYANVEGSEPSWADADGPDRGAGRSRRLARGADAQLVIDATDAYERWLTVDVTRAFDAFVDDVSNWYIRRSRRRFWDGDEAALANALVRARHVVARRSPR